MLTLCATAALVISAEAQSVVYHLHSDASATSGFKQLQTAGPNAAQSVLQTAALQGAAVGEKQIAQFDTASGVPNTAGKMPTGATVGAVVWMRKTANFGTMFPRIKVRLNSSSGTSLCTATGTTALTTTLTAYSLSCATTANITMTASDRLYVWAGVNLTVASSSGAFRGELGLEGTLNGAADSRVDVPTALPAPTISSLTPGAGPIGTTVTIAGNNFRDQQLTSAVKFFNNRTATVTSWTNTSVVVTVPASSVTGNVTVTVAGTASAGVSFGVGAVPTITQLSTNAGLPATPVVITGTGFGATKGSSTVKFNGLTAATTSWSSTSIATSVPAGATSGNIVVTVGGIPSSGTAFTVPTLNAISVAPDQFIVPIKGQQRFTAWGHYSDGIDRNVSASAVWASSDPGVASVDVTGLATIVSTEGTSTVSATIGGSSDAAEIHAAPSRVRPVSPMGAQRVYHTATLLPNGQVLIAGGQDGAGNITNTAELYDPATGRFTPTGNMKRKRHVHTATLLNDGRVLLTGGLSYHPDEYHRSAEIYDPATGTFALTGSLSVSHFFHTATLLADGRVLIAYGATDFTQPVPPSSIYDPATGVFTATGYALSERTLHAATLLNDGRVLFTGGYDQNAATTELYDPVSGTYSSGPPLVIPRHSHTATRLADGRVLVAGGGDSCPALCTAEIFDPVTNTFSATAPMSIPRSAHTATLLDDGKVLMAGGQATENTASLEVYDPAISNFVAAGALASVRALQTATRLQDGSVLLAGGYSTLTGHIAELYFPAELPPTSLSITPAVATMAIGESREFTVVDQLGHVRDDAEWSVDIAGVASVDPDTGVVSATAIGNAVLTATIGSVSGTAQLTIAAAGSLPAGTVRWSVPSLLAGVGSQTVVQGTGGGPGLFSVNSSASETQIQALTPDGQQLWQTWLPVQANNVTPNGAGGLLFTVNTGCDGVNPMRLVSLDSATGMWAWQFVGASTCTSDPPQIALRMDGVIAVVTPGNLSGFPSVMMLDGLTGTPLAVPAIPKSTFTSVGGQQTLGYSRVGPPVVDNHGETYLMYEVRELAYPPVVVTTSLYLLKIKADFSTTSTLLTTTNSNTNLFPGRIIPDGSGNVIATWTFSPAAPPTVPNPLRAAFVSAGGAVTPYDLPILPAQILTAPNGMPINPLLAMGENDTVFASYGSDLVAFAKTSGAAAWSYAAAGKIAVVVADNANGVVAKMTDGAGLETLIRFDSLGAGAVEPLTGNDLQYVAGDWWVSADVGSLAAHTASFVTPSTTGYQSPTQKGTAQGQVNLRVQVVADVPGQPDIINNRLAEIYSKLQVEAAAPNPTCSAWLENPGTDPANQQRKWSIYLPLMIQNKMYVHGVFTKEQRLANGQLSSIVDDLTAASTNAKNPDGTFALPPGPVLGVNDNGSFYNAAGLNGAPYVKSKNQYGGGNPRAQAETLLHELAHFLIAEDNMPAPLKPFSFWHDFGNNAAQNHNRNLLDSKCGTIIRTFAP